MTNKYYHRGNREVLNLSGDVLTLKPYEIAEEWLAVQPVAATLDFDAPIGWVDNVREVYQTLVQNPHDYKYEYIDASKDLYDFCSNGTRRILLVKIEEAPNKFAFI